MLYRNPAGNGRNGLRRIALVAALIGSWSPTALAANATYRAGVAQQTLYGEVDGAETNDGATLFWRGVPYAAAPVGTLRWKAPEKPAAWTGALDATGDAPLCPQMTGGKALGSEDCLTLDIWRPNTDETGLPVLFYIHGGNNQGGNSGTVDFEQLAVNADAVVVSVNYRLGLLGFNNLPALKTGNPQEDSGNYTLLDLARALDWIDANIAAFGGNADNITVSGFSAGGRDVMAMLISPLFHDKFQKAISFSGGMTLADTEESTGLVADAIAPLVVEAGIKPDDETARQWLMSTDPTVKDFLYDLPNDRLAGLMTNAGIRMAVFPHLYNDGVVLPKEGFETDSYNAVPLMMTTGTSEFSLFARFDPEFAAASDTDLIDDSDLNARYRFAENYGSKLYEIFNAQDSAREMIDRYDAPIYTTRFAWGEDPQIVGDTMADLYGSFHGIWIPFATERTSGFAAQFPEAFDNTGAQDLAAKFGTYLRNFMWDGDPNGDGLTAWQPWQNADSGPTQLILNADMKKADIRMSDERTPYEDVLKAMNADDTISAEAKQHLIETVLDGRWFSFGLDRHYDNENTWVGVE
ncbi:carboxylesterase family protein [Martelella mangrovi]|uniref:Carboxylic ester hydrolase n=1 Tax=Martelella mangrovi TaxID=1397477 RepID=A0ABV2IDE9_9HYPH